MAVRAVDYHAKDLVPLIPSYLQDTPDLLRQFETLNEQDLPEESFPISIDVVGLYTNIPTEEAIEAMRKTLETRTDKTVSTNTLIELLEHVLRLNIFEFNSELYIQNIGTAMGTKAAPTIANIFMAEMDEKIQKCAIFENKNAIHFYKRFIDDVFMIWTGTVTQFKTFMDKINLLHKTLKFTSQFNKEKTQLHF